MMPEAVAHTDNRATQSSTLDIVIVNHNAGSHLQDCLRSVTVAGRAGFELRSVVVVDNASTDGSVDYVDEPSLPLLLIRNADNRGFAAACNQGARLGRSDLVLFLNPDTRIGTDALERSVRFMSDPANASVGICGGQMLDDDGTRLPSCSRFPTLPILVAKMSGLSALSPRMFPSQRLAPDEMTSSGVVDQVIGAYFLVRRQLFDALDGFDERFFVYMEEVDLSYRARRLGYRSYFLADASVYHAQNVSAGQLGGLRRFYVVRSQTEYARKHWPPWQSLMLAVLILTVELPVRAVAACLRGGDETVTDVAQAASLYARFAVGAAVRDALRRG